MKKCNSCEIELEISQFHKDKTSKDGLNNKCKDCIKLYKKEYYLNNPSKIQEHNLNKKERYKNDPELRKQDQCKEIKYQRKRKEIDPIFKFKINIRVLIGNSFKRVINGGFEKNDKTELLLGCTLDEFIQHLQSLFTEGMTLKNHGEWEIDHKIPLASAKTEEEIIKLSHYTNFQPLWRFDNRSKGAKML
jgi:hypothetical protein